VTIDLHREMVLVVAALATALAVGGIAERLRIPYSVALLLATLPFEHIPGADVFAPSVIFLFLPALIFEAAWNIDFAALRRTWRPATFLAVPGTLITAFAVGWGLALLGELPFSLALLLGVILAATDPIAVIATFRRLAVPRDLQAIVEGEALFNDGIAVVFFTAVGASLAAGGTLTLDAPAITASIVVDSIGGALVGGVIALGVSFVCQGIRSAQLQIVATVVAAFGAYLAASGPGFSGIFAALVAGATLRSLTQFPTTEEASREIDQFWSVMAFFAYTFVFLLLGAQTTLRAFVREPVLIASVVAILIAVRVVLVYVGLPFFGEGAQRSRSWQHVIVFSGLRGALPVALALQLPATLALRQRVIDAVFGAVLVTFVAQGIAIGPLVQRLSKRLSAEGVTGT
jgi:CPA1 family monovalent cation:H+ antiporter